MLCYCMPRCCCLRARSALARVNSCCYYRRLLHLHLNLNLNLHLQPHLHLRIAEHQVTDYRSPIADRSSVVPARTRLIPSTVSSHFWLHCLLPFATFTNIRLFIRSPTT
ncbi:unnamed protein product [Soboliphyme baturini]|uniref:Secreted protein n=1 Tax=Soboliphyme baturini TaxID=241478 RepID=A0A183ICD0_9BILA|nr:unnamed protein product [Soboliphyme baturini]